jgi:methionine-rich copper-binding protein CopC
MKDRDHQMKETIMRRLPILIAAAALTTFAGAAYAHPKLLSATPAANATVAKPTRVELRFSEKLMPAFSKADLTMAAMPGMAAMKMPSTAKLAADGRTLVVTPKGKLPAGRYTVDWHIVSTDTHKVAGSYAFAVK